MIVPALILLQTAVHEPKPGTKERKAVLDALRPYVQKRVGGKIEFKVEWLRSNGETAFFSGTPQRPGGADRLDEDDRYAEQDREGMFGGGVAALMKRKGGKWTPDTVWIGPTDVPWDGLWTKRGLARSLFP